MNIAIAPPLQLTIEDLARRFGPMPLSRICFNPFPGTATEQDILNWHDRENRHFELVDGILVEKTVGIRESILAVALGSLLFQFVHKNKLGVVAGEGGMMRLFPGRVRIPDVSFIAWDRLPNRRAPQEQIPDLGPTLAVEILSPWNTRKEMATKLEEYSAVNTPLVWYVDPADRTVTVYTAIDQSTVLHDDQDLDGGTVLPGFSLPLRELFAELDAAG